jgi:hypothetical protein
VKFLKFRPSSGTHRTVDGVNTEPPAWVPGPAEPPPPPPRSAWRSGRKLALAGVAAVVLAIGGVAVAAAATSDSTPSPGPSASPSPGSTKPPDRERHPFLAGTVVSASGNTITITDVQGFQRTIHTSSATTYEDGLTAIPKAGTRIHAVGTVDSDKTSLKATRVGALPDRAERRFPGHGFPGDRRFPRGDKDGASPAPGTPTPSPTA